MGQEEQVTTFKGFDSSFFRFLEELKQNNDREWFQQNKQRYEQEIVEPALGFISAMQPLLKKISPAFVAEARRTGGSMFRIYRDIRFSNDKSPFKTNVGIQFPHAEQKLKRKMAPGFYVHLDPGESFIAAGIWHPDSGTLKKIRSHLDSHQAEWSKVVSSQPFSGRFSLAGDRLKTAPRDYPGDHPLIEDLKRKDFIAVRSVERDEVLAGSFLQETNADFRSTLPFVRFLCDAVDARL